MGAVGVSDPYGNIRLNPSAVTAPPPISIHPKGGNVVRLRKLRTGGTSRAVRSTPVEPATALETECVRLPSDLPTSSVWASWVATMLAKAAVRAGGTPHWRMRR